MKTKNQRWWLTDDHVDTVIAADPQRLYEMVSNLPRIGEWSPECEAVDWVDADTTTPVAGTRFVGHNAVGPGRTSGFPTVGAGVARPPTPNVESKN